MKTYDKFPVNMLETQGPIKRNSFNFIANNCKIWCKGNCISDFDADIEINALVNPFKKNVLELRINNAHLSDYINEYFSFSEISHNLDRIIYSNNLMDNCEGAEDYEPTNMSLFYYQGELSRIYINISSPYVVMLELTSYGEGAISDVENPVLAAAKLLEASFKNTPIDLDKLSFTSTSHQRFENGEPVRTLQRCKRVVIVQKNEEGIEGYDVEPGIGYLVVIGNLDGEQPVLQMTPKPMEVLRNTNGEAELRGFPCQAMTPFGWIDFNGADYGLTVVREYGEIKKCILHMHDRDVDIVYYA